VHLEHRSEPVRTLAARRIIDIPRSNSLPLILAGDFNSKPADFPRATLDPDGRTALSELLATGPWQTLPTSLPESTDLTFSSTRPKTVIDWILLPPEWRIISKTVIQTQLSDHMPVVMEVQLDGEQ
jgi:endonuclease/exonuclease/phosphatase family metal-dependent hydrolase